MRCLKSCSQKIESDATSNDHVNSQYAFKVYTHASKVEKYEIVFIFASTGL